MLAAILLFVSKVISVALALMIRLHPNLNKVLDERQKQIQLETSFNEFNDKRILVGLDQTRYHERYHNGCASDNHFDSTESNYRTTAKLQETASPDKASTFFGTRTTIFDRKKSMDEFDSEMNMGSAHGCQDFCH